MEDIQGVDRLPSAANMQNLSCRLCKIMEHVVACNFAQHLKINIVLLSLQHGFCIIILVTLKFSGTKNNFRATKNNFSGTKNNFSSTTINFNRIEIILVPLNIIFVQLKSF